MSPSRLTSTPSSHPTSTPARPRSEIWTPVPLGASPTGAPPGRKSLPTAVGGEIEAQLGNGPADEGRERVAVGSRPRAVARGVGVRAHGRLHAVDQDVHTVPAHVGQEFGPAPEPVVVRARPVHAEGRGSAIDTPADDLVSRVLGRAGPFQRDPRVDSEDPLPSDRARGVDLDHRFGCRGGIGGLPGGIAPRLPPARVSRERAARREQEEEEQEWGQTLSSKHFRPAPIAEMAGATSGGRRRES